MFMRSMVLSLAFAMLGFCVDAIPGERLGLGRPASAEEIRAWDIDVRADGTGLPAGRGTVASGQLVFAQKCAACHGDRGQGGPMDKLTGGESTLTAASPIKTVGSFWPHATTLFDYVRRAMPFNAPQTLSNEETYAVVAYVLHLNGILSAEAMLDASSLPRVKMPNRDGFTADPRPDVASRPCEVDYR
jgi:cytochrome c